MCLEKRQVKARNEKTETDKIDERRIKSADWTFSTGVSWHETRMPLVSSSLFLWNDSRTGGLHIHSYKHNLWCYACGSCPGIFRIPCCLTQPVTGILSNVVVNPLWHSLAVTSLHIPRYQWGCNQSRKHYKQKKTSSTSRQNLQGRRLEVANRNQWNSTQIAYLNNTILKSHFKISFQRQETSFHHVQAPTETDYSFWFSPLSKKGIHPCSEWWSVFIVTKNVSEVLGGGGGRWDSKHESLG